MALVSIGTPVAAQSPAFTSSAPELLIQWHLDLWVQYVGTAAQIQAEGLIPDGFVWPAARDDRRWVVGGLGYWLRRTRPVGHKGSYSSWANADSWSLRITVEGRDLHWMRRRFLERKAIALAEEYRRLTPQGDGEWRSAFSRYWAAKQDVAFQAFRARLLPQLKRRGRAGVAGRVQA